MAAARTLHVRCATWDQVDVFVTRKLRKGRLLSMKVPFTAASHAPVTLGLELPNGIVVAIEGVVQKAAPIEGDGAARTWIEIELVGFTDEVRSRIQSLAKGEGDDDSVEIDLEPPAPQRAQTSRPVEDELPADEKDLFNQLSGELRRMRQAAVHEVLGVSRDAEAADVRAAWKLLVRRHHPDLVARRDAPAISHLAEELTILANRAYDRLRAALVAEGRGTVAGPTLSAPPGWLVGFDDIQSAERAAPKVRAPTAPGAGAAASAPTPTPGATPPHGGESFEQRARAMLGAGEAGSAREVLAAALVVYPRSKPLRSLYYVATALAALQDGEVMLAQSQLETALAHHEQCVEAAQMLEHIKRHGGKNVEAAKRIFT